MSSTSEKLLRKKARILEDCGYKCVYAVAANCPINLTVATMTMEHLLPKSKGGKKSRKNLVAACEPCNQLRDSFTSIKEFEAYAIKVHHVLKIVELLAKERGIKLE